MPYRIYQGKEVRTSDLLVLPRGEISVDIDTLELRIGDGYTPGGIPLTVTSTGTTVVATAGVDGGGSASVFLPTEGVDGGLSASTYLNDELINGGGA